MTANPMVYMGSLIMNYSIRNPTATTTIASFTVISETNESLKQAPNYSGDHNITEDVTLEERSCIATIFLAMALAVICILTIIGNVLVIASVILNANLRTTTNYFIANLAMADLLLGTTVLPFSATLEVLQYWVFGQVFCDVWAAIDVLCCTASILSLCVISIDRYIGVTRPLQHARIMRHTRAVYVIIFVWLLSVAISVAPLIGWKEEPDPDPRVCTVTTQPGYVLFSVAGSFYIPCLIILVVYFRIYQETVKYTRCLMYGAKMAKVDEDTVVSLRIHTGRHVSTASPMDGYHTVINDNVVEDYNSGSHQLHKENSKKRNSRLTFSNKVANFKREKKAAKTLGIVVGVFITCWFPFFFVLPLDSLCPDCSVPPLLFKLFFWLGYCNSTMNPIIYTCSSLEFRRAFLAILCCRRCRRRPRISLTELQLRARAQTSSRRRARRQQQQKQQHQSELELSLRKMSSGSVSPIESSSSVIKDPGSRLNSASLRMNYLNGDISPECPNKSGCLQGVRGKVPLRNICTARQTNFHYQNGNCNKQSKQESSVFDSSDDYHIFLQKSSQKHPQLTSIANSKRDQNSANGSVMIRAAHCNATSDRLSSPESSDRSLPSTDKEIYKTGLNCTDNERPNLHNNHNQSKDNDVVGSDGLSCYSLAETISCSD